MPPRRVGRGAVRRRPGAWAARGAWALAAEQIGSLALDGVDAVVLSAFNPAPETNARFVCRRLRR
ncbi:hypothetical protein CLD22_13610, partial [Rubrivivax gelatinosus]|nr:hypothetical protein [Rubrivivax gelatinosus]